MANATGLIVTQARTGRVASIGSMVDRVKAGFEPERRLTRLLLDGSVSQAAAGFTFDEESGVTAIAGGVFATLAFLEGVEDPRVEVRADAPAPRTLKIEIVQRLTPVSGEPARYLSESGQVPPNELTIALGLLGAKYLAVQYGGSVEFTPIAGGSLIQITLSKLNAN